MHLKAMGIVLLLLLIFSSFAASFVAGYQQIKTTVQIIRDRGYPAEIHHTKTEDGYLLTMHRIPNGKNETARNEQKEVFFIQHGLTGLSGDFITHYDGLAFTLADAGYDVWLGNTRGNMYSQRHVSYKNDSKEFWDFSFDEMAKYDLPAMIDYALANTSQEKLWYVGHSQGTMNMFAKLSDDLHFNDKLKGFFAMGPVTRLNAFSPYNKFLSHTFNRFKWLLDIANVRRWLLIPHYSRIFNALCILDDYFCHTNYTQDTIAHQSSFIDWDKVQRALTEVMLQGAAAVKNLYHYSQLVETGKFQKYDYGLLGNLARYWSRKPPVYDITKINTKIWLFSGSNDTLSTPEDVKWIADNLGNIQANIVIDGYNHIGFLIGKHVKKEVYDKIIKFAKNSKASCAK